MENNVRTVYVKFDHFQVVTMHADTREVNMIYALDSRGNIWEKISGEEWVRVEGPTIQIKPAPSLPNPSINNQARAAV